MAATTGSVAATGVAPWNSHKNTAPLPPATLATSSHIGRRVTRISTSSSGNASTPDVAVDSENVINPVFNADTSTPNPIYRVADIVNSVVPDYPLDSLPRHSSTGSHNTPTGNVTDNIAPENGNHPRTNQRSENVLVTRTNQRNNAGAPLGSTVLTVSRTHVSTAPLSVPSVPGISTMAPHGDMAGPSHVHAGLHIVPTPPVVSHSAVSVSVNRSFPTSADGSRPIRTQDLNVGVSSRLDAHRHTSGPGPLPDLLAHSQVPANVLRHPAPGHGAPTPVRTQVPPDPRISSSGHRVSESHSRHRNSHGDHERSRHRSRRRSQRHENPDDPCKASCYKCIAITTSFRWILVTLSLLGVCCVVTGIVLAALHAAGNSFLFLAIMFIGLGVLLVVVVGVGWKCTPRGHEPIHALFGLGDFQQQHGERRRRRRHRRDGRWHGGMAYPEFQYRRPPPTYNASMETYQHQLMVAQTQNPTPDMYDPEDIPDEDYSLPSSPPPSYRSRASTVRAGVQITFPPTHGGDLPDSRPPTYRSHPGSTLQGHTRVRPSLPRDDDDDDRDRAPEDVAFTSDSVFVDASTNQNGTSIQIGPTRAATQNVTVSVTTVSVTAQSGEELPPHTPSVTMATVTANDGLERNFPAVDAVGDIEGDRVETAL